MAWIRPDGRIYEGDRDSDGSREATQAEVDAYYAAMPARPLTFLETVALFSQSERDAVLSSNLPSARLAVAMAAAAQAIGGISLDDPRFADMLTQLVADGLITESSKQRKLAGMPPE